jgi:NitT/TauT family transport system permease protein
MSSSSASTDALGLTPRVRRWPRPPLAHLASAAAVLAVWQILALFFPPSLLPGPSPVLARVWTIVGSGQFAFHMAHTVARVVAGFLAAFVVSLALGILMGVSRTAEKFFEVEIMIGLTVPSLAWAVLALMWFGIREIAPIFTIFVILLPLITLNMWQGTKALDQDLIEMARAFRVRRGAVIREVVIPQLVPYLLAATRFGLSLAWKVAVIAEMLGISNGVGYMIHYSFGVFSMEEVLAWTLSFTLVMMLVEYGVLNPIEARITRWRRTVVL